jgi:hypothetical protein
MDIKKVFFGLLLVAVVVMGIRQAWPSLETISTNLFSTLGTIVVVGLLGYGIYRIIRE